MSWENIMRECKSPKGDFLLNVSLDGVSKHIWAYGPMGD